MAGNGGQCPLKTRVDSLKKNNFYYPTEAVYFYLHKLYAHESDSEETKAIIFLEKSIVRYESNKY